MADQQMIAKEVVDAMLDEVQTSMQTQINALLQRNATLRGTMKQLEMHGTVLEGEVARLKAMAGEIEVTPPLDPATEQRPN